MRRMSLATFSRSSSHKSAILASVILRSAVSIVALMRTDCRSSFHRDGGIGADALGFACALLVFSAAALLRTILPADATVWPALTGAPPPVLVYRPPLPPPVSAASRRPARRRHSCCWVSIFQCQIRGCTRLLQLCGPLRFDLRRALIGQYLSKMILIG